MTERRESKFEYKLINSCKDDLISHIKNQRDDFPALVRLAISDKQPYSWRAAWLLWSCIDRNDERIRKHIKKMIDVLPDRQDNQQRELLIVLQKMELGADIEGRLFDICIKIWETVNKNPSLRYNAFKILVGISRKHPDLLTELNFLTESYYLDNLSDNVKKSIFKLLSNRKK